MQNFWSLDRNYYEYRYMPPPGLRLALQLSAGCVIVAACAKLRGQRLLPSLRLQVTRACTSATASSSALEGRLYRYRTRPSSMQAFESGPADTRKFCCFVGGLTDGLLACSYVEALAEECAARGWALVQPIMSSSYAGYGTGSLDRDVEELAQLARYLQTERGATAIVLAGHSTGTQDAVHFMSAAPEDVRSLVRAIVLQAPVSDRESATLEGDAAERAAKLKRAEALVAEGKGDTLIDLQYGFVPLTAARYASLNGRGGLDDMFSSDLSDAELAGRLRHLATPGLRTLFVHSLADEYVPPSVDAEALARRFVTAAGGPAFASSLLLPGAKHNLASPDGEAASEFVRAVGVLLSEVA